MSKSSTPKDPSDLGGVAARDGFKYQDHIAALYALDMLVNPELQGVRCECTDDIDLIWKHFTEFVQVKKTEKDNNWTLTEVTGSDIGKKSILQKSLECDCIPGVVSKFRIVTRRGVNSSLKHLTVKREIRTNTAEKKALVKSVCAKLKKNVSPNGNDGEYWVTNCYWEVIASNDEAYGKSYQKISKYSQTKGIALFDDDIKAIYNAVLENVGGTGDKSNRIHTVEEKTYTRLELIKWIDEKIDDCRSRNKRYQKVYKRKGDNVFVELISFKTESGIRQSHTFIVEYSKKKFRYKTTVKNLLSWMPEFLLLPNELAEHSSSDAFKVWSKTIDRFKSSSIKEVREFLGELLFHIILRSNTESEPISGCLFVEGLEDLKTFHNVHIINGDELCLGVSFIAEAHQIGEIPNLFAQTLSKNIDPDIFDENRQKYFDLKNDDYLSNHNIDELLSIATNIEDTIDKFRFGVLISYDSNVLSKGYIDEYKVKLKSEVEAYFEEICSSLSSLDDELVDKIRVYIYLIPFESIKTLENHFLQELNIEAND